MDEPEEDDLVILVDQEVLVIGVYCLLQAILRALVEVDISTQVSQMLHL
jgi:hypothetical protein